MNAYAAYQKVTKWPLGHRIFSKVLCRFVPYFRTIHPQVLEMRPGYCSVEMKERKALHNHLGTIHAIAMCNLCEIAMGMVAEATVVPPLRWIPKGINVQYLKKGKGKLTASCEVDPKLIKPGDIDFPVQAKDKQGDIVIKGVIPVYITEIPREQL